MSLNAVKILKISITNNSKKEILEEIQKYLFEKSKVKSRKSKNLVIFTPNTEQIVLAQKNSHFAEVLNQADIAIPDSVGVVWAGRVLTKNGPKTQIPGVEFMENLVQLAENRHVPIGLIGGRDKVAVKTLECLRKKYPGLIGWGEERIDEAYLAKKILDTNAVIIFVALGPPKQEQLIEKLSYQLSGIRKADRRSPITDHSSVVLMAVGGSFDIISGRLPRAPVLMRTLGLEWFWRLILEPRRIFRQLALIEFVWVVLQERLFRGAK